MKDVLVVLDRPDGLSEARDRMRRLGMDPRVAIGGRQGLEAMQASTPDLVVLDHWRDGLDPIGFLKLARIEHPDLLDSIIAVTPPGADGLTSLLQDAGAGVVVGGSTDDAQLSSILVHLAPTPPIAAWDSQVLPVQVRSRFDPRSLVSGDVIDERYTVIKRLGSGSMATVYAARDGHLEETIAVKLLHAMQVTNAVRRFRRETRLARDIVHPNVVRTYEAGMWNGHPYLTMQLLDGAPLASRLKAGTPMELKDAAVIARAIGAGLEAIHAHGVDHRDLSAANIFVPDDASSACILDFGAARILDNEMGVQSGGYVIGTPAILPPERILGVDGPLGSSDAWALGVLLFMMLCGEGPFASAEPFDLLRFITDEPVPPPHTVVPMPLVVSQLILGLLHKNPQQRMSVGQAVRELKVFAGGLQLPV